MGGAIKKVAAPAAKIASTVVAPVAKTLGKSKEEQTPPLIAKVAQAAQGVYTSERKKRKGLRAVAPAGARSGTLLSAAAPAAPAGGMAKDDKLGL